MALQVRTFVVGPIETNCYLVTDPDSQKAIVVDPGAPCPMLDEALKGITLTDVLLTHAHFDHIGGVKHLIGLTGAKVWVHESEADWLGDPERNLSGAMGEYTQKVIADPAEGILKGGETLPLLGCPVKVAHTPGHTPGHIIYVFDGMAFVGDLIFRASVGRTDFPGGSGQTLLASIENEVLSLPEDTRLFPGHGPATTVGAERRDNPFLLR